MIHADEMAEARRLQSTQREFDTCVELVRTRRALSAARIDLERLAGKDRPTWGEVILVLSLFVCAFILGWLSR